MGLDTQIERRMGMPVGEVSKVELEQQAGIMTEEEEVTSEQYGNLQFYYIKF